MFRLDVSEAGSRRRIGNADEMVARRALNLPAGELRLALQRLVTVRTIDLNSFVFISFFQSCANLGRKVYGRFIHTFCPANAHVGLNERIQTRHVITPKP